MEGFDQTRIGVVIGSGMGGLLELETQHGILTMKGLPEFLIFMVPKLMVNAASAQVAARFDRKAPLCIGNGVVPPGVNAIGELVRIIQRGDADIMLAGSSEAVISPLGLAGFSMKASTRNDAPQRPAVRSIKTGTVLCHFEGAGVVVVEETPEQQEEQIYAEVQGMDVRRCISSSSARTKW